MYFTKSSKINSWVLPGVLLSTKRRWSFDNGTSSLFIIFWFMHFFKFALFETEF